MSFSARVLRSPDLQHVRFWDVMTLADAREQFATGPNAPGFYPGIPTLVDLRGMSGTEMDLAGIMSLRDRFVERHVRPGQPPMLIALLAEGEVAFGSARIFETICSQAEGLNVGVFSSLPEALSFLNLPETINGTEILNQTAQTYAR